ncbi:arsenate reductase (glutaredoxin) [Entomortierella parvispora]|uniref:Arsenate reductase (Glutaredoxin) n=1 Tax=Entomortierella parvispora TaxID=205924 RepID=A0A9P3M2T2_9FUNG|nr:arsenate reductase (glutaredoxin) [Entomortierella parvispora]
MSAAARTITFFHNPRCSTSRNALKMLQERSVSTPFTMDTVEYLKNPLTNDQVRDILTFLNYSENPAVLTEFLRKDAPKATTVEDVQAILAEDPALMQRPLVVDWAAKKAVIGRPADAVLEIVSDL